MKLSEAIRLGSLLRPQGFGFYLHRSAGDIVSCALGAAAEAVGIGHLSHCFIPPDALRASFPILDHLLENLPCNCCFTLVSCRILDAISHLNDGHSWTRERIADWVETQEALEQGATVEATELEAVPA